MRTCTHTYICKKKFLTTMWHLGHHTPLYPSNVCDHAESQVLGQVQANFKTPKMFYP